jgi:hypothetical protein
MVKETIQRPPDWKMKTKDKPAYMKAYRQSERGKMIQHKAYWKYMGINFGKKDYMFPIIYKDYLNQTNCECCYKEFVNDQEKCLDHDHSESMKNVYNVRGIICAGCNQRRRDKYYSNSSGEKFIYWNKASKIYDLRIIVCYELIVQKYFKSLYDAIEFRDKYISENPWIYT